jgi:diacylglycerol O-acyltransferase
MGKTEKMAYSAATLQAPALPLMLTGLGKRAPLCNVTISNVPGAPQTLYLQGARLDEAYPVSIPMDYNALNITVSSYGDSFAFGFIACRRTVPGLQRMIDHTDAALAELRKALGKKKASTTTKVAPVAKPKLLLTKTKAAPAKVKKLSVAKPAR